jgi:hypothetical protein
MTPIATHIVRECERCGRSSLDCPFQMAGLCRSCYGRPAPVPPCSFCGVPMLEPADACGFCHMESVNAQR